MNKNEIRKRTLYKLNNLNKDDVYKKNKIILNFLISYIIKNRYRKILIYMNMKNEIKVTYLIKYFEKENIKFYIPKVFSNRTMKINEYEKDKLILHKFGYYESISKNYVDELTVDLVIVPGIVFDKRGNRIGYGGGYYDVFLKKLKMLHMEKNSKMPSIIAACYDFQVLDKIPVEKHDIKVDKILTEKGFIL